MKIVFLTPASDMRRHPLYRLGNAFYGRSNSVTGPLILGRILKDAGHDVEVWEELYRDVPLRCCDDADVVCIYTMTSNAPRAYLLADRLRAQGRRVILGGMHASVLPEEALRHADQIVTGEAETVILDVVEGRRPERIVHAHCLRNLDDAPLPDYSLLKTPCAAANVLTTRGCPFSCSFCTTSRMYAPYRERSVESVLTELRMYRQLGFRYVNFEDDNFTANRARTKELLRRMIAEGLVFGESFFFGRTDLAADEELLTLLRQAHLTRVLVGIESLNQASLDAVGKRQKLADIENCAAALERHKIRLIASLVLGIDTDTPEDIRRGVDFARRIHAYQLQPAVLTPFPGTPVYEQYQREGRLLDTGWDAFDMMNVTFRPRQMSAWRLQKEFFRALKRFYSFASSFTIARLFGPGYGLRRIGLFVVVRMSLVGAAALSLFSPRSRYGRLRRLSRAERPAGPRAQQPAFTQPERAPRFSRRRHLLEKGGEAPH